MGEERRRRVGDAVWRVCPRAGDDELMQVFADWVRRLMEELMPKGTPALAPGLTLEENAA